MTLFVFGVNHNTAKIEFREQLVFSPAEAQQALTEALFLEGVNEVALLSTCNRTEIYCCAADDSAGERLVYWLGQRKSLTPEQLQPCLYRHQNAAAVGHMMSVACGLDSLVLGEPQILGQIKSAYGLAKGAGTLGSGLHAVFQRVFSVAKRVRSDTAIGENPVSVAYAAVSLAQQIFSSLEKDTALLIGAGETIELVAQHLARQGVKRMLVANRTLANARDLAQQFGAEAILLGDIPEHLHRADIVIASTASQLPILGKGAVEAALKRRKHKPMFMVDIAVPRDIEPQVGDLSDVYLYTVDDLSEVIDQNKKSRQQAATLAKDIVQAAVVDYERDQRALSAVETVKAFRDKVRGYQQQELDKAHKALRMGADPEHTLNRLARSLSNKFMHAPSVRIKAAGADGEYDLISGFSEIFDLSVTDKKVTDENNN